MGKVSLKVLEFFVQKRVRTLRMAEESPYVKIALLLCALLVQSPFLRVVAW